MFIMCFLFSTAQEDSIKIELYKLEQKVQNTNQTGLKIPIYEDLIKISYPDYLEKVFKYSEELLKLAESVNNKIILEQEVLISDLEK